MDSSGALQSRRTLRGSSISSFCVFRSGSFSESKIYNYKNSPGSNPWPGGPAEANIAARSRQRSRVAISSARSDLVGAKPCPSVLDNLTYECVTGSTHVRATIRTSPTFATCIAFPTPLRGPSAKAASLDTMAARAHCSRTGKPMAAACSVCSIHLCNAVDHMREPCVKHGNSALRGVAY